MRGETGYEGKDLGSYYVWINPGSKRQTLLKFCSDVKANLKAVTPLGFIWFIIAYLHGNFWKDLQNEIWVRLWRNKELYSIYLSWSQLSYQKRLRFHITWDSDNFLLKDYLNMHSTLRNLEKFWRRRLVNKKMKKKERVAIFLRKKKREEGKGILRDMKDKTSYNVW